MASPADPAGRWRIRDTVRAVAFTAYLVVQVATPLRYIGSERPERFAWQMFRFAGDPSKYIVELQSGTVDTIPLQRYAVHARPEVDWGERYPPHLCTVIDDAMVVYKTASRMSPDVVHPCR